MTQEEAIKRAKEQAAELKRPLYVALYLGPEKQLRGNYAVRRSVCVPIGCAYVAVHPDGRTVEAIREW